MQIYINNQVHHLKEPYPKDLATVLTTLLPNLQTRGTAVAINDMVIPQEQWNKTPINPHAEILIITATQGG